MKYNFNNDKGTEEVYGFESGDESWEIRNNTDALALFQSDDFTNWASTFEGRYPDGNTVTTNLQQFVSWVASTDTTQATGDALSSSVTYDGTTYTTDTAAYRLAKFKNELSDWANVEALEFYYIYTELFLLMDSRAKNAFPSFFGDGKWLILPYDMDTAIGINNEGKLAFGPYLEDTDQVNGVDVFNGQQSVLWINLRTCFADELATVYNNVRVSGLSYATVEARFEEHQSKWPEAIFNEDAYYKYIEPLTNPASGETATNEYLGMLLGSKQEQRKWWLYNRFQYIDNKYEANVITNSANRIYFRANAVANMTLTPAHDTYLVAKYGSAQVKHKALKDVPTVMECTLTSMSDTECYIYGCENVKSLGDMVGLNVSDISLGAASNLQYLKLGDETLQNTALTSLDLSACKKLKYLDLRNCVNLTGVINVSNCYGLEEIYLTGTQVTAVNLPRGGILKKVHLPEVASLVIINQPDIEEFVYDGNYSNISTLRVENAGAVNDFLTEIVIGMNDDQRIRLVGVDMSIDNMPDAYEFYRKLRVSYGLAADGSNQHDVFISGSLHIASFYNWSAWAMRGLFTNLTVTVGTTVATVSGPYLVTDWSSKFGIDKNAITSVVFAHSHEADGTEDEVVDVGSDEAGSIYAYRYGTEIVIANNAAGIVILYSVNFNTGGHFSGMTGLQHIDVTYLNPYMNDNGGVYNGQGVPGFFNSCSALTQIDGLVSFWSAYRGKGGVVGKICQNPFSNTHIEYLDTRFLYGLAGNGTTYLMPYVSGAYSNLLLGGMSYVTTINMSTSGKWLMGSRTNNGYLFFNNALLTTLVELYADGSFKANDFAGCTALTHCIFRTDSGIDFTTNACKIEVPPWDYPSLASIIECAVDKSDAEEPVTLTLNATTFALLDNELVAKAAAKNYTLASA